MNERLPNIHPGEVLDEEFLKPLNIPVVRFARAIRISPTRIVGIVRQQRRITPDLALRFGKFFGTSPQFWLGLQMDYDLEEKQQRLGAQLDRIHPLQAVSAM